MTPKDAIRFARETIFNSFDIELNEKAQKMEGFCARTDEAAAAYNFLASINIDDLLEDSDVLTCLRNAGVDNWEGWDFAMEEFHAGRDD
jgi:hypothetical protein